LRAGIVGIGKWGSKVVQEYAAIMKEGIVESVAICDIDDSKTKPFIDICETSNDLDKILREVDTIHVCTPNSTHFEVTRKALEMNVNVLVEKPMAGDVNHAFDLVELSMRRGVILQVGHVFRFADIVRKIKHLFENKEFGEQYYFDLEWSHLIPPIKDVDVIHDLLPHPLDIINFITGKWPLSFEGVGKAFRRNELIEAACIQADYDEFFANIHLSWIVPVRRRKLEIIGTTKSITADCVKQTASIYDGSFCKDLAINANNTIRDEIMNFLDSTKTGKSDYNSSIVGARTIQMVDEAIKNVRILSKNDK